MPIILSPKSSLGIPREHMPQINDVEKFCDILKDHGIAFKTGFTYQDALKSSQGELNLEKINSIDPTVDRQIFVSKEGYIVDGHHYWAAQGPSDKIKIIKVDMNIIDLLNFFNNHDATFQITIEENKQCHI